MLPIDDDLVDFSPVDNPTLLVECAEAWFDMGFEYGRTGEIDEYESINASCLLRMVGARAEAIVAGFDPWDGSLTDFTRRVADPWRRHFWRQFDAGVVAAHEMADSACESEPVL